MGTLTLSEQFMGTLTLSEQLYIIWLYGYVLYVICYTFRCYRLRLSVLFLVD